MLILVGKNYSQFYAENVCLSGPIITRVPLVCKHELHQSNVSRCLNNALCANYNDSATVAYVGYD